jgi:PIN domain nuclease of toxin-antitoxin system
MGRRKMNGILLDTHTWLWFANGDAQLSKAIKKIINQSAQEQNAHIAAISLWEVAMLEKKRRLAFNIPCLDWIEEALEHCHLNVIPLTPSIATHSCDLPGKFHGDPADQIIVATAHTKKLQLLTRDEKILSYSKNKYITATKV